MGSDEAVRRWFHQLMARALRIVRPGGRYLYVTEGALLQGGVEPPWSRVVAGIALGSSAFAQRRRSEAHGNWREQQSRASGGELAGDCPGGGASQGEEVDGVCESAR